MASKTAKYLTRDQVFRITLSGLMPLTVHYVYFENNLVASSNLKPLGGVIGDQIKTDTNGQVTFDYYCNGGTVVDTTPFDEAQKLAAKISTPKQLTVANRSSATLAADYQTTYLSYASTLINVNTLVSTTTRQVAAIYQTVEVPYGS
jgi:hypothetical protein